jgi:hypothetical protein
MTKAGFDDGHGLSVPNNPLFNFSPSSKFTIRLWVKFKDLTSQNGCLIIKGKYKAGTNNWSLGYDYVGGMGYQLYIQVPPVTKSTNLYINDFNLHHITLSCDGGTWRIFDALNEYGFPSGAIAPLNLSTNVDLYFPYVYSGKFYGLLDEVEIYNDVYTPDQLF